MEFVNGINIDNKEAMVKEGINIKEVSNLLSHCFAKQIFEFGVRSDHQFLHADPHSGNVFARKFQDPVTKKSETQIVLLDHGLYKKLDEEIKYSYSLLWKGILNQNEEDIRIATNRLGVKNHFLFAAMVTSKDWNEIMNKNERDEHKRLTRGTDKETKTDLQIKFNLYMEEIVRCLQEVDNDLMLVLKVNDYLRNIDGRLGNPINSFIHIVASSHSGEVCI
jgi:aarF domain-containing kinase